jgi:hypothetical protein
LVDVLKCGYRFRAGKLKKPAEVRLTFEVGSRVRRTPNGAIGEVTAIDGEAVTVRWPGNRTSIHLGRDLKPLPEAIEKRPNVGSSFGIGAQVRRTTYGAVGEVIAVDGEAVTVRWPDNRSSSHLRRDLKES